MLKFYYKKSRSFNRQGVNVQYSIKITKGLDENPDAIAIRKKVFVEEQGFKNEFDDIDPRAWHLVLYIGSVPAATGRLFDRGNDDRAKDKESADGPDSNESSVRLNKKESGIRMILGRIAVIQEYRGRSLGGKVMAELEKTAKENGTEDVEVSAQERVRPFYEKLGYTAVGDVYYDEFCPHIRMVKSI